MCNNPSVSGKHPGTCEKVDHMSKPASKWYTADVVEKYHTWQNKQPTAPIAGAPAISQFGQEAGVGERALKHLQEAEGGGTVPLQAGRKKALIAEPGYIWSKSPSTTHVEFKNRMGSGTHPDEVVRSILADIHDHFQSGEINNRDAHRAANEAIGRYLMIAKRKQAWTGWGPDQTPKRHKVAGWDWDGHLNGYISTAPRKFACSCGEKVDVPDYHNCKCGKIWNTYVIGTGGDRHEASAEKFIAREIPNRQITEKVIVAAIDHFHDGEGRYTGPMKMKDTRGPDPYGPDDNCLTCGPHFTQPHIGHDIGEKWAKRKLRSAQSDNSDKVDPVGNSVEDNNPFPSKHQPRKKKDNRAKGVADGKTSPDWYKRDHSSQQWLS